MATIAITVGPQTKSKTISAPDVQRALNALRKFYGQVNNGSGVLRDLTDAEVFDLWSNEALKTLTDRVLLIEGAAAQAAITPVVLT